MTCGKATSVFKDSTFEGEIHSPVTDSLTPFALVSTSSVKGKAWSDRQYWYELTLARMGADRHGFRFI